MEKVPRTRQFIGGSPHGQVDLVPIDATPGTSITPQESGPGHLIMKIAGVGKAALHVVSNRDIARLTLDGRAGALSSDGNILMELGGRWKEVPLELVF